MSALELDTLADIRPGHSVGGRYRLLEHLGRGAYGSVWRADQAPLGRRVALKLLRTAACKDPEHRRRFKNEAKLAAKLGEECENIARVFDMDVTEDGIPFVAMELLEGEDLSARLEREERLPFADVIEIMRQVGIALEAAHAASTVHRDLKPANLFLTKDARGELLVKLLDFGCARSLANDLAVPEDYILGTPCYMSPEQIRGQADIDASADLWAAAAIAYEMLAGRAPFDASTVQDIFTRVRFAPVTPPSKIDPQLPRAVDRFFERALAKDRSKRFRSLREMTTALAAALAGTSSAAEAEDLEAQADAARAESTRRVRRARILAASILTAGIVTTLVAVRIGASDAAAPAAGPKAAAPAAEGPSASARAIFTAPIASTVTAPALTVAASVSATRATAITASTVHAVRPAAPGNAGSSPSSSSLAKKAAESWRDRGGM